jgi:hypothetical protein
MLMEVQSWPYNFPESDDFPKWDERGNVCGRLLVKERCVVINVIILFSSHFFSLIANVCWDILFQCCHVDKYYQLII